MTEFKKGSKVIYKNGPRDQEIGVIVGRDKVTEEAKQWRVAWPSSDRIWYEFERDLELVEVPK